MLQTQNLVTKYDEHVSIILLVNSEAFISEFQNNIKHILVVLTCSILLEIMVSFQNIKQRVGFINSTMLQHSAEKAYEL